MEFLNSFLTCVLVITTIVYAYLTYKIAKSNTETVDILKEQNETMMRPYIVIEPFVRSNTSLIYLRIKNTGRTSAKQLKLRINKDFYQFDNESRNLRDFPAFSSEIDSFAPNQELLFGLAQGFIIFSKSNNRMPLQFEITASYKSGNKSYKETSLIDLRVYELSEYYKDPIVEELSKIGERLKE